MTFPSVAAVGGGTTGASTSHVVDLPAGVAAGNLLVAGICFEKVTGGTDVTWPGDWTEIEDEDFDAGVLVGTASVAYRNADGGEGVTITVTTTDSVTSAYETFRITGHNSATPPEIATAESNGGDDSPNPPNLSPSFGGDTLWLEFGWYVHGGDAAVTVDAASANYTDLSQNGTTGAVVGSARRELNSASENPGVMTLSAARRWAASTVAIRAAGRIMGSLAGEGGLAGPGGLAG